MREVALTLRADDGPAAFRAAIEELHAQPDHPRFAEIQAAINDQVDHFAFLELEMAATAEAGAFVAPSRVVAMPVPPTEGFEPSFRPGAHVPHLWLKPGVSTIDVLRFDRFTLFAPTGDVSGWQAAVAALPPGGLPVAVVSLDPATRGETASAADYWGGTPYAVLARPDGRIGWIEPPGVDDRDTALAAALAHIAGHRADEPAAEVA
jgi:2,4-dichlorophenol 6-monooxygenase